MRCGWAPSAAVRPLLGPAEGAGRLAGADGADPARGDDAPVADWREKLIEGFRLGARSHRFLFDEHERMLPGDPERVEEALGIRYD